MTLSLLPLLFGFKISYDKIVIGVIIPLVPGAGIYYTAYYLITKQHALFAQKGLETFEIASAIVLGIIFGFAIPQSLFTKIGKVFHR